MKPKTRGVAKVREVIADEHRAMQTRAYERIRPYLSVALRRLRQAYPAFQTVVFDAKRQNFAFIFGDGTRHHEAPAAFDHFHEACKELAQFSEIEWLTADDAIWQLCRGTPQPTNVIEQYRHIHDTDWHFWMKRTLRDARYYMRKDIHSRMVFGSHRPGYGKRIIAEDGTVIDEWVDPIEPMIMRALRDEAPMDLDPMSRRLSVISGFGDGYLAYFISDVEHACERMCKRGVLRRTKSSASSPGVKFSILRKPMKPQP